MAKIWRFGFLSLGLVVSSAHAVIIGSDDDSKIAPFAREFADADPRPELSQLQPGKQWVCFEYFANNSELQYQRSYLFFNRGSGQAYNAGRDPVKTFALTPEGIKGFVGPNDSTVVRVNRKGDLIVEKRQGDKYVGYVSCIHQLLDTMPRPTVLSSGQMAYGVCGFRGRPEDRIADCGNIVKKTSKGLWALITQTVTNTKKLIHFWKDLSAGGLIWSDPVGEFVWDQANGTKGTEYEGRGVCQTYALVEPTGTLPSQTFFLPSKDDYQKAESHGIREALDMKNPSYWWWTSSAAGVDYGAWGFSGYVGDVGSVYRDDCGSVRCVAR